MERFDQLFSLYHSFPLENNPHIHPDRNPPPLPYHTSINASSKIRLHTRKFDGNDPAGLYSISEYFDYYDTPPLKRRRLLDLCSEGQASKWFRWMQSNILLLLSNKIPPEVEIESPSSVSLPPWIELPGDVIFNILQRLGAEETLRSAKAVCTTWWKVSKDPVLWRVIDFSNPRQGLFNDEYNTMCRCALDRSQGQLVDLTIQYFGDDALMDYIADR